jgi:hypothetical protein
MIGGIAGALRWGLPRSHPGSQTPWLPTPIISLQTLTTYLDERYLSEHIEDRPDPVPLETVGAAFERDKEPSDPWLCRFLRIELFMRGLVRLDVPPTRRTPTTATNDGSPSPTAAGPSSRCRPPTPATSSTSSPRGQARGSSSWRAPRP